jgi:YVTN family beta-propeller protein
VGGYGDNGNTGAAWVFIRSNGAWTQQSKLVGTGTIYLNTTYQGISVALSADGNTAIVGGEGDYVADQLSHSVSVIDTATNTLTAPPIPVYPDPLGVAVTPDGSKVYVANERSNNVSVIDTATDMVIGSPIPVGSFPFGIAVTPDGSKVYVVNHSVMGTTAFRSAS